MANFIGILKKGDEKKGDDKKKQDVPDELPSLGEDTAPAAPEVPKQEASNEAPAELPALEPEKKPEILAESPGEKEETQQEPPRQEAKGESFFFNISKLLNSGSGDKILYQDLLANMKQNWSIKNESDRSGLSSAEERNIKANIADVIAQLRLMESKWKAHKLVLEEDQKVILEQEEKIKAKEKDLKKFIRQYKVYQHVPESQALLLRNSIPITSISELINALRKMTAAEFSAHANKRHNAFSDLISIIEPALGRRLKSCYSKEDMLRYLEAFVNSVNAK
ncbi:MAG: hypothetical protein V1702_01875 [Candidatus Woesearchaeota archaeon]